jgi:hypothetical protein
MPPREWCEAKTQFAIMFDDKFVKARYSNLIAASSVGKCPLVRTARRSLAFKDSMAFVV